MFVSNDLNVTVILENVRFECLEHPCDLNVLIALVMPNLLIRFCFLFPLIPNIVRLECSDSLVMPKVLDYTVKN